MKQFNLEKAQDKEKWKCSVIKNKTKWRTTCYRDVKIKTKFNLIGFKAKVGNKCWDRISKVINNTYTSVEC